MPTTCANASALPASSGWAGPPFPTHVKLSPPDNKPIDTLILNGVECEPYLTADHRLMLEATERLLDGIAILQKILGVKRTVIGIEANKPDAIAAAGSGLRRDAASRWWRWRSSIRRGPRSS